MARPTAHLLHGFIGAGKTRFARRLAADLPAIRFTPDEWMVRLHGNDPPADRFPALAERIDGLMEELWTRCLALGLDVVIDTGCWSRAGRDRTRALVARHGGTALLYRLTCSDEVAHQRIAERNGQAGALHVAAATYRALRNRCEPLGPDEPCIEVDSDDDPPTPRATDRQGEPS